MRLLILLNKITIFCLLSLMVNVAAYCGQLSRIELTDGSIVNGEVVAYLNGIYTINTINLGKIDVQAEKIVRIESVEYVAPVEPVAQLNNLSQTRVSAYGQALVQNPENADILKGLANNPTLAELASDPAIQQAAKTNDFQSLLNNPKFMSVINDPKVQETVKKLKQ